MRVFISWSGDRSRAIGDTFRRWLPSVLQVVRPYFSPDDIAKGARWNTEIAKELEASRIGMIILTPECQNAPWLMFEAGALAKNLDRSKVCPILFGGLEPTDLKGPLVQFQSSQFEADDMKRMIKMMNAELGDGALLPDVLEGVFDMWWPKLQEQVHAELQKHVHTDDETGRTERDMLEEVLGLTRTIARDGRSVRRSLDHPAFDDLVLSVINLVQGLRAGPMEPEMAIAAERALSAADYLSRRGPPSRRRDPRMLRHMISELRHEIVLPEPKARQAGDGGVDSGGTA